jgi:hypothetical protein
MTMAAEIAAGLAEAGAATGAGPLVSTLRSRSTDRAGPWVSGSDTRDLSAVTVVQVSKKVRDGLGMTERSVKMLLISATGAAPAKGDHVAIGIVPASVTGSTVWARIGEVEAVAPGGTAVLYKAMLEE